MVEVYDQELKLESLFKGLSDGLRKVDGIKDDGKRQNMLRKLTASLQEAKSLIRDFEREARLDGMNPEVLAARRKQLVQELNGYINLKRVLSTDPSGSTKGGVVSGKKTVPDGGPSVVELMASGRLAIAESDKALSRAEAQLHETIAVGTATAETLVGQGHQMEKVLDDLDEIHFTMKKARHVLRDMARSVATDACFMGLLFLTIMAIAALIVIQVLKSEGIIVR